MDTLGGLADINAFDCVYEALRRLGGSDSMLNPPSHTGSHNAG